MFELKRDAENNVFLSCAEGEYPTGYGDFNLQDRLGASLYNQVLVARDFDPKLYFEGGNVDYIQMQRNGRLATHFTNGAESQANFSFDFSSNRDGDNSGVWCVSTAEDGTVASIMWIDLKYAPYVGSDHYPRIYENNYGYVKGFAPQPTSEYSGNPKIDLIELGDY